MNNNVYQIVTDRIIKQLEAGTIPWLKPWTGTQEGAYNGKTKQPYSLLNQMMLKHDDAYLTWKQVHEMNGTVNQGAKAEIVVFWKMYQTNEQLKDINNEPIFKDGKPVYKTIPLLRYYQVFWVGDTSLSDNFQKKETTQHEPIKEAENIINNYLSHNKGLNLKRNKPSDKAYYSPSRDEIVLPMMEQFKNIEQFYTTAFHEMTHSTGAKHRLDRLNSMAFFGNEDYSKEELVAEIGSAFLANKCGIETEKTFKNSIAYLQSWIKALKNDPKMIVFASSQSEKAVNFILEGLEEYEEASNEASLPSLVYPDITKAIIKPNVEDIDTLAYDIMMEMEDMDAEDYGTSEERFNETKRELENGATNIFKLINNYLADYESEPDDNYSKHLKEIHNRIRKFINNTKLLNAWYYPQPLC